jgi:hypothetical protein
MTQELDIVLNNFGLPDNGAARPETCRSLPVATLFLF